MTEIAWYNYESGLWLDSTAPEPDLFSEQSERLLETWPRSGMTRSGRLLPLPTSAPRTDENESSSLPVLPTPRASDGVKGGPNQRGSSGDRMLPSAVCHLDEWGDYEPAIRRAETATGRPAPAPTEPNTNGNPRLASAFAEWMMMLPAGHVTGVGLSRPDELKAIGNGVVPAQAYRALELLVPVAEAVA